MTGYNNKMNSSTSYATNTNRKVDRYEINNA